MDLVFVYTRLILGAIAAFLAIMLWAKTRDMAWMLIVIGTVIAYIEIIYSILEMFGILARFEAFAGFAPLAVMALATLKVLFFIAAFLVMVIRRKT